MKKPKSAKKILIEKLRKTEQYKKWRNNILKTTFPTFPKYPKWTQVHHLTNFSEWLDKFQITTLEEGISCKGLWVVPGVAISRGEHFLLTRLGLYKKVSNGFIELLALELDRLKSNLQKEQYGTSKAHSKGVLEKRKRSSNNR